MESNVLLSLSASCDDGAREEIDESASDVVVYGMVRGRLPVPNCGKHCSLVSLGQPTLNSGCMQKVPTDNVQGVVRYGSSRVRLTSGRPMSSFTAWCPVLSCLSRPADGDGVSPGKAGYMDWLMRLVPTSKVSTDLKYSTLMSRTHSW